MTEPTDFLDEEISLAQGSLEERRREAKSDQLHDLWNQVSEYDDGWRLEGWIFE